MKFGVRRSTIDLMPPTDADLEWIFRTGSEGSHAIRMRTHQAYIAGKVLVGVIWRPNDGRRVGFVILVPAGAGRWEFSIAIPQPSDRDLFSAVHACDALCHYMFDHVDGTVGAVWRIREDNVAAQMLSRRMGHSPQGTGLHDAHSYYRYTLNRDEWLARRARLEARAGGGQAFSTL